jgi:hypothetical protein
MLEAGAHTLYPNSEFLWWLMHARLQYFAFQQWSAGWPGSLA